MLPLGHIAYTWATLTWLQSHGQAQQTDFRAAALASLLPDLVDKPLSLTILSRSGTSQGPCHTLAGQALLTLAAAVFRPKWLPYAAVCNSHLLLDQMWKYPRTLFYPFSGQLDTWRFMGTPQAMLTAYAEIATRPSILALETAGLLLLGWVIRRGSLFQRQRLLHLLRTGEVARNGPPAGERAHSSSRREPERCA